MPVAYSMSAGALITNAAGTALCENCCPVSATCETTQVRINVSGVGNIPNPGCGTGCNVFNGVHVLPFGPEIILAASGCNAILGSSPIWINRDYVCGYTLQFNTTCGQDPHTWDALVAGQFGVGWAVVLGVRSVGVYNFGGAVSDFCIIWDIVKNGTGQLLDFSHTFIIPPFTEECGVCGSFPCEWDSYQISMTVENA